MNIISSEKFLFKKILILIFCAAFMLLISLDTHAAAPANLNPFNAVKVDVNDTNVSEKIEPGQNLWYVFEAPEGNLWVITRLTGTQTSGAMQISIMDEQLNMVKETYTHSGNHIAEIICRMEYQGVGSKEPFMPKLIAGKKYYVRIIGTGEFNLNIDSYTDDYSGDFDKATGLSVGVTVTGMLERDEDVDSFYFDIPNNYSYNVKVYATKKMDVDIADSNDYIINSNSLRVMRDNSTSEYTVSGYGERRYFFMMGKGGTQYNITVSIGADESRLGLWTKVIAEVGTKKIRIETIKGAKISIIVKPGSKRKDIKIKYKKKKQSKVSLTQTKNVATYKLTRKLKPGDKVIVTAKKKRYKEFNYKKKMR